MYVYAEIDIGMHTHPKYMFPYMNLLIASNRKPDPNRPKP